MALTDYTSCHSAFYHFVEARGFALEADTGILEQNQRQRGTGE
jgi:hypothetical protein